MTGFDFSGDPDRVIHEPARLKIMAVLSVAASADFMYLMRETGLTRGNLSVQLTRLQKAGYIKISKEFVGKSPRTTASMIGAGKKAFDKYRAYLTDIIKATSG